MNEIRISKLQLARAIALALGAVCADSIGVGLIYLGAWISVRLGSRGRARGRPGGPGAWDRLSPFGMTAPSVLKDTRRVGRTE